MLLYNLKMEEWKSNCEDSEIVAPQGESGTIPMAVIVYSTPDLDISMLTPNEYVASQEDEDAQMKSF